ncbi:glycosyltransferase family 10 domain-containing protein [Roseovarius sp. C7]|uniref:glycosyltransferase family 10 domain-containing protein n=1 Tax=Roseovarius sp. C7 TaxID=3398643 RepID=UPI0039F6BE66
MTSLQPRVAVLPNARKLGYRPSRIALSDLIWPLGVPDGIAGKTLADLRPEDHLLVYPRKTLHVRPSFGTRAKVSIMVVEPTVIHGNHMRWLRFSHRRFHRVLSPHEDLLNVVSNGSFHPFGSTWVPDWSEIDKTKSRMCSLIASSKRSQTGHRLRHEIVERTRSAGHGIDVMGGGYAPFGEKSDGLAPYRYSVVIENVREKNYFTEKLVDALLCQTVPIYWGCPNISEFIDPKSMIICESADEIMAAIEAMSEEDYAARLPAVKAVEQQAAHWADELRRAAETVLKG